MDALTLILDAIALGVKTGIQKAAGDATAEQFRHMMAKIKERLGKYFKASKVEETEQALMSSVDEAERAKLANTLAVAQVHEDQEIVKAAQSLLSALSKTKEGGEAISNRGEISVTVNGGTIKGDVSGVKITH
jgi:phosphoribosylformylglycinamidine (FGAM) synthase PurS component